MRLLLISIISFFTLVSCDNEYPTSISVINQSDVFIDSIKISSYGLNLVYNNLSKNDTIIKNAKVEPIQDGTFHLTIYTKDSVIFPGTFGYFTKGGEVEEKYIIKILKDFSISER